GGARRRAAEAPDDEPGAADGGGGEQGQAGQSTHLPRNARYSGVVDGRARSAGRRRKDRIKTDRPIQERPVCTIRGPSNVYGGWANSEGHGMCDLLLYCYRWAGAPPASLYYHAAQ